MQGSLLVWWNGSVVTMQNFGSAVRIPLELSLFFPQKFSKFYCRCSIKVPVPVNRHSIIIMQAVLAAVMWWATLLAYRLSGDS